MTNPLAYIGEKGVYRMGRLVINGEEVYELDEVCMQEKREQKRQEQRHKNMSGASNKNAPGRFGTVQKA